MAIEKLTKEKLIEYGFGAEAINRLLTWDNYSIDVSNGKGRFFATNTENLIYSGKDKLRLAYFKENEEPWFPLGDLELLPEYLEKSFEYHISLARGKAGSVIVEQSIKQRFIENQIEFIKEQIIDCKKYPNRKYKASLLNTWELSLDWVLNYVAEKPTSVEEVVEKPKEMHNDIFKSNAFEVFEQYHKEYTITDSSKTDLSVLYQLFERDGLFVATVELKHYIDWLRRVCEYDTLIEIKKADLNSKPNIQRKNTYNRIKKATLK